MKSIVRQIACLLLILAAAPSSAQTVRETIKNAPWTSCEVGKGVVVKTCHFDNLFGGQQDIYFADGDLNSPGVSLKFVSKGDGTRKAMSGWAAGVPSTVAAINGAWADPGQRHPQPIPTHRWNQIGRNSSCRSGTRWNRYLQKRKSLLPDATVRRLGFPLPPRTYGLRKFPQ